jgi:hypothetical protein
MPNTGALLSLRTLVNLAAIASAAPPLGTSRQHKAGCAVVSKGVPNTIPLVQCTVALLIIEALRSAFAGWKTY